MSRKGTFDVKADSDLSNSVKDWARYQNLAGESDTAETSPVRGTYDWRSYVQEEARIAQRREAQVAKRKQPERAAPAPAPAHFYA